MASGCRGPAGHGCQDTDKRCHGHRAASPVSPQRSLGATTVGSCGVLPHTPGPDAHRSAAERNGAVRWNLGAGGDAAAGGGHAQHVAAYVRRVQGRTAMAGAPGTPPRGHQVPAGRMWPDTHTEGTAHVCGSRGTRAHMCWIQGDGALLTPQHPHAAVGPGGPRQAEVPPHCRGLTVVLPAPH